MNGKHPQYFQARSDLEELEHLRTENDLLRRILAQHGIPIPLVSGETKSLALEFEEEGLRFKGGAEQRISLFRSLFRGREDVFAIRWESPHSRSGYSPKADRDWKAYLSARETDRKQVDRQTRKLRPLTDDVVRAHLCGEVTIGIYPLLTDETCWFLAADFDKKTWQKDAAAFLETCDALGVPAALERSRSGNGGHVWIFFDRAIRAALARRLGCTILTQTMERRHQLGFDSYDRFFPNQDTLPKGGFGNLIALPLQKIPRQMGNSVFVDSDFRPYPDQWAFLSTLARMPADSTEWLVSEAQRTGRLIGVRLSLPDDEAEQDPWSLPPSRRRPEPPVDGPLPERVQIVRANLVYIEKKGLPPAILSRLLRLAAFQNPEFYKAQAMRLSTFGKPRVIGCAEEMTNYLALPRGCLPEAVTLFEAHRIHPSIRDERSAGNAIQVRFHGQLRPVQEEAVAKLYRHDEGVLCAPTAFGKTTVAAWLIAARKVNTLVLVHRQQLLDQWRERLAMFLELPKKEIGQIGGGKIERTGRVDVGILQSLHRKGEVKDFIADYGQVIVDECHHISAFTFEKVMKQVKARYVVGLTATPTRKDGHHPIIYMQCGPVRFSLSARMMTVMTPFEHKVIPRYTSFRVDSDVSSLTIHDIYSALIADHARNELIVADLVRTLEAGRCPLLLTSRIEHLTYFSTKLADRKNVFVLKGGMGRKQRRIALEKLTAVADSTPRVILATGSYIGEGFDDSRLDTLFLAMPISWKGTLQQYVGRLHRYHDNKRLIQVFDYVDAHVAMLARMYERRLKGYRAIGYEIHQEGSSCGRTDNLYR